MREDHLARATVVIVIVGALRPRTAAALLGAPTDGRDWPSYGHDLHRTFNGRTTLDPTSVLGLAQAWFFPTGDAVTANPIVVNGALYVGSWDGNFYALDAVSGQERWHFTIDPQLAIHPQPGNRQPGDLTSDGGVITSSAYFLPAAGARPDLVIFGGGYTLYALRATDGSLYWKHAYTGRPELPPDPDNDGTRIFSSPAVVGNKVLFSTTADGQDGYRGRVIAADVHTGNPAWVRELDVDANGTILNDGCGGVWTSPTIIEHDNVAIVAVADCHFESPPPYNERVLALNIADGTIKWVFFPPRGNDPMCDWDFGATANLGTAPTARRSSSASAPRTATATRWIRRPARSAGRPTSSSAASPAASSRPPRTTARGSTARPRSATSAASRQTGTSSASRSTPPTSRSRSRACTPSTPRPGRSPGRRTRRRPSARRPSPAA